MPIERILVAIDGSKHSEKVVDYASGLSRSLSAEVVLLYVVPELEIPEGYKQFAKVERADPYAYLSEVGEQIPRKFGRRLDAKKVEHKDLYVIGRASSKILEVAAVRKVSMIVLGLHGMHGARRLMTLGSIARRVIESSNIPVVVVP